MQTNYYLPLAFEKVIKKKPLPVGDMEDSIKQFLSLILTTHLGEYRFDNGFGCEIWDWNYHNIHSVNKWKTTFKKQITEAILASEKRLRSVEVNIQLTQLPVVEKDSSIVAKHRQKIFITITGTMIYTNKPLQHQEMIYFSPLSLV